MNGIGGENQTDQGNGNDARKPVAFCQHCGKPLDRETARVVGPAVYCEPCLAARLAGTAGTYSGEAGAGYGPVTAGGAVGRSPMPAGEPNPGLAALLGLVPGVGAMYNEQYAKGIVHLVIFAVLVSFSHVTGIFILFVFGWLAYMSIEAHHTAKARRDGTPLPNPFGLNDVGERLGFGKAWPSGGPNVAGVARDAAEAAPAGFGSVHTGFGSVVTTAPPPSAASADPAAAAGAGWGAPVDAYPAGTGYSRGYGHPYSQSYPSNYGPQPYVYGTQVPYGAPGMPSAGSVPPIPPISPMPPIQNRFPAGAIWLIGLGTIFLLGTTGIFRGISAGVFVGFLLIALGLWVFIRRMTDTGLGLGNDGTTGYQYRLLRALKHSVWLVLFGVLSLLDDFRLIRWEYSWPWLVILAGVMMLVNRAAYNSAAASVYPATPVAPTTAPVPAEASPNSITVVIPSEHTDTALNQGGN